MSDWLTAAELRSRFGADRIHQLADRDRDGQPGAGVIDACIERAEGRARSSLLGRYAPADLPTTPETTGAALKRVVGALAYVYLCETYEIQGPEVLRLQQDALGELRAIVSGAAVLGLADEPAVDVVRPAILSNRTATQARMSREALCDW